MEKLVVLQNIITDLVTNSSEGTYLARYYKAWKEETKSTTWKFSAAAVQQIIRDGFYSQHYAPILPIYSIYQVWWCSMHLFCRVITNSLRYTIELFVASIVLILKLI